MKLTTIILIISLVQVNASSFGQRVTFTKKGVTIDRLFNEVRKQTGYGIFITTSKFKNLPKINVNFKDTPLKQVLDVVTQGTGLTYSIDDKTVVINAVSENFELKNDTNTKSKQKDERTLTGIVTDKTGKGIEGVTVTVKSSGKTALTNSDGKYRINLLKDRSDVLVFSMVGYITETLNVDKDNESLDLVLKENLSELEEVVVVGYGTQKRLNSTGAVASINSKQLLQSPVANLSNALAGRLPGLISVQRGGEPGFDAASIWIRGFGTYGSAQSPLIMVDGVERAYDNIDPNEIESITILKDASSTAIYGVRGANGVVLVTTKRGTEIKPQINVNTQANIQTPTRLPEYLDSYDALHLYREGLLNDGNNASQYTDEYINKFRNRDNPTYEYLYPNVNWLDELIKPYSFMNQSNMNVNGSNPFVRYFVSVSYMEQNGLYKYEDKIKDYNIQAKLNRYNFRANVDLSISKNLDMELNLGGIIRERNYPNASSSDLWYRLKSTPPWWYPATNPDGSIPGSPSLTMNPYGMLTQSGYQRYFENTLQATTGFNLRLPMITDGLSLRGRLSFDALSYRNVTRAKGIFTYKYTIDETETDLNNGSYTKLSDGTNTLGYDVNANGNKKTVVELFLNYDRRFQKHDLKGLVLYTQQSYMDNVGGGTANAIGGLPYKYQGIVGRAAYSYNDSYFAEFNFGYNGSENFPAGKRFGFFPAVSAGWLVSNQEFMKNILPSISLLKIRASAGVVGNDRSGQRFMYQGKWSLSAGGYGFGVNDNGAVYSGAEESAAGNADVTWERAKKYNLGVDFALWNNLLKFEFDIFQERRDQILTQPLTIPSTIGISNLPTINAGIVDNKGFEAVLTLQKNFARSGYFVRANYTFSRNKIIEMAEPAYTGRAWAARTGTRIFEHQGLSAIGLFKDWDDIASSPTQHFGPVQPGDIKYLDLNGDGQIDDQDHGFLGRVPIPERMAGVAVGFNYHGVDLSVLFQGAFGGTVYYGGGATYPFSRFSGVLSEVQGNYFSADNPDVNALFPRMTSNDNANNYRISDFWHRKSDYVRLKNVEIGYTFPKLLTKRVGVSQARIYLNGINLMTWSSIKTFDPEIPDGTGGYPQQQIYNLGFNFTF